MKWPVLVVCCPTMATSAPSRPSLRRARTSPMQGWKRRVKPTASTRPASRTAATAASALAAVERDRLLDEHVLAGARSRAHLRLVLAVRRRQHHRVDAAVRQDRVVAVDEPHVLLAAEVLRRGARARVAEHEADVVALALHRGDERASPAPQPDDCCANHVGPSWRLPREVMRRAANLPPASSPLNARPVGMGPHGGVQH